MLSNKAIEQVVHHVFYVYPVQCLDTLYSLSRKSAFQKRIEAVEKVGVRVLTVP
jgi:hypothetical protein